MIQIKQTPANHISTFTDFLLSDLMEIYFVQCYKVPEPQEKREAKHLGKSAKQANNEISVGRYF